MVRDVQTTDPRRDMAVPGRYRLVSRLLTQAVAAASAGGRRPTVLDCGGGSGSFAVPLAGAGAHVTVIDVSADALATLRRRAEEAGVADRIAAVQADVEQLADATGSASFDLVLAHGILEAVDSLPAAFRAIAGAVGPGGLLSVLVGNPVAGVLARALGGDLAAALAELRALDTSFGPPGPAAVQALARDAGLLIEAVHGVGVFAEFVPGSALETPGAAEALADLEDETSGRPPFSEIASRVHLLARRPA
jgi:S-adenosylmethionine-dependent methyltransferase